MFSLHATRAPRASTRPCLAAGSRPAQFGLGPSNSQRHRPTLPPVQAKKWEEQAVGLIDKYVGARLRPVLYDPRLPMDPSGLPCLAVAFAQLDTARGHVRVHKLPFTSAGGGSSKPGKIKKSAGDRGSSKLGNGVLFLLSVNYAIYIANLFHGAALARLLPLFSFKLQWWQLISYSFYHQSFSHLANNMFMLWAFGKAVEQEEGAWGVVGHYVVCALGVLCCLTRDAVDACRHASPALVCNRVSPAGSIGHRDSL